MFLSELNNIREILKKQSPLWYKRVIPQEYNKRLLLRCIHHFESDLIYNLDHMCISGTESSSLILSQTK